MSASLGRIAIVTPHPWGLPHPANDHVLDILEGLGQLRNDGEQVPELVIVAPSIGAAHRRRSKTALRELARGADPTEALTRCITPDSFGVPVISIGTPIGRAGVGMRAELRLIFERAGVGLVHVIDPLHGDVARAAARIWDGVVLATLTDLPDTGRLQVVTAPLRHKLFESIDECLVPYQEMHGQVTALAEGALRTVEVEPALTRTRSTEPTPTPGALVLLRGRGDEQYIRTLLRTLSQHPAAKQLEQIVSLERWVRSHRITAPRDLRGKTHIARPTTRSEADSVLQNGIAAVAFPGTPFRLVEEARAAGLVVIDGADPDEALTAIAAACDECQESGPRPIDSSHPTVADLARTMMMRWTELVGRRRAPEVRNPLGVANRPCFMDLHMHTSHSWDCATDPEALLWAARKVGLTGIAVTDHNEISGALVCAELADEYGIKVIVGEEVKTSEGEVIGLFLSERIEPGLSWTETIRQIRAQDGIVYVPHPFDRLHTIPSLATLRESVDEIDVFEVYNARLTFEQYNRDAQRFARKYNLLEGAGSDAHVIQGLGTAAVQMPEWDDPEGFLVALRDGEIHKRPTSVLMLQGLKLLDTVTGKTKASGAERHDESADDRG